MNFENLPKIAKQKGTQLLCIVCKNLYADKLQFLKHMNETPHNKAAEEIKKRVKEKQISEENTNNLKRKADT